MQINSNLNANYINNAKVNSNNEKLKATSEDNVKEQIATFQDNLKKQVANLLKDVAQDECGTYDPHDTQRILLGVSESKNPELYAMLESEFMEGMLFYGMSKKEREYWIETGKSVGAEEMVKVINSLHPALFNENDDKKALFKLEALQQNTKANNIYNQAFIKKDSKLLEFLEQNKIIGVKFSIDNAEFGDMSVPKFYLANMYEDSSIKLGDVFCGSGGFADRLMDLFALDDIDEFMAGYLALKEEVDLYKEQNGLTEHFGEPKSQEDSEKDESVKRKPIEVKSDYLRESMEDILSKINKQKIKDERDLLALLLAYKNGENLYDKRV
ncbi:hypothetical protein AVANS_1685 [Campylobacter sp. RM5004]|uniref:hypothetical protein n=1 Tax=Campylobacter sp. RM5004 TaxID=1660078 RepID=UPI001EFB9E43|nr:hypothetical protein [Campylobacter sp. RM5004]ULO02290.1 hypothetical protein AVANS_1685 [Campylobacter sp. RM5004]